MTTLYTIGYEGRGTAQRIEPGHSALESRYAATGIAGLIRALEEHYIDTLIDVRHRPLSHNSQFSKSALDLSLMQAGIEYRHLPQFGIPSQFRSGDRWQVLNNYECRMRACRDLSEFQGLEAEFQGTGGNTAIMCVEADHHQCHRARLARVLADRYGYEVVHIPTTRAVEEDVA